MTDILDQASKLEEQQRAASLAKQQANREKPLIINGVRCCLGCEITVPNERIKAVDAVRCIPCQVHEEAIQKHYRR